MINMSSELPSWQEALAAEADKLRIAEETVARITQDFLSHPPDDSSVAVKDAKASAIQSWKSRLKFSRKDSPGEIRSFYDTYIKFFAHVPEEAQTLEGFLATGQRNTDRAFQEAFGPFWEYFFTLTHPDEDRPVGISNFGVYHKLFPSGEIDIGIYSIYIALDEPYRGLGIITANRDFQIQTALSQYKGNKDNVRILIGTEPNSPAKLSPATYAKDMLHSSHPLSRVNSMLRAGLRKLNIDYLLCPLTELGPCDYLDLRAAVVNATRDKTTGKWSWTIESPDSIATADLEEFYRRTQGSNVLCDTKPEECQYKDDFARGLKAISASSVDGRTHFVPEDPKAMHQQLDGVMERLSRTDKDAYQASETRLESFASQSKTARRFMRPVRWVQQQLPRPRTAHAG